MSEPADGRPVTYSPETVRRIFERATEIDSALATGATEQDLRQIASEIGLSQRALDLALQELHPVGSPGTQHASRPPVRPFHLACIGAGAGAAAVLFQAAPLVVFVTLQACSFVIAAASRGPGRLRTFVVSNAALWSGVLIAHVLVLQAPSIVIPVLALAGSTALGIAALSLGGRSSDPSSPGGPTVVQPRRSRLGRRLQGAWERFVRLNNATDLRVLFARGGLHAE